MSRNFPQAMKDEARMPGVKFALVNELTSEPVNPRECANCG